MTRARDGMLSQGLDLGVAESGICPLESSCHCPKADRPCDQGDFTKPLKGSRHAALSASSLCGWFVQQRDSLRIVKRRIRMYYSRPQSCHLPARYQLFCFNCGICDALGIVSTRTDKSNSTRSSSTCNDETLRRPFVYHRAELQIII